VELHEEHDNWLVRAMEPDVLVPVLLVLGSGVLYIYNKFEEEKKELGRLQFLEIVTAKMDDIVNSRVVPNLSALDQRMIKVYQQIQVQHVRTENLDRLYNALSDRVSGLEAALLKQFDAIEEQLSESLGTLPCIERTPIKGIPTFRIRPCPNEDDITGPPSR
jgi:hypothetical protein